MKRLKISLEDVAAYDNLLNAAVKAARAKRNRRAVQQFFSDLDARLLHLREDILAQQVPYGRYREFRIFDPKPRQIRAACFEDRVLHHAVMNPAAPVLDKAIVPTSFACRKGRGSHRAVRYAQQQMRKYPVVVKTDIEQYFSSIDHNTLMALIRRKFKGRRFLGLIEKIVSENGPGKGLPIGALTSQWFANFYLDGLDRFILGHKKVMAHTRYMDDTLFWCSSRQEARECMDQVREFVKDRLRLGVKEQVTQINPSHQGITFCGYRVFPGRIGLTRRKKKRYRMMKEKWETLFKAGLIDEYRLQQGFASVQGAVALADAGGWIRMLPTSKVDA